MRCDGKAHPNHPERLALSPATIRETCLYTTDLQRAIAFYRELLAYEVLAADERFCAMDAGDDQVFLLFLQGASTSPAQLPGVTFPALDDYGPAHVAFGIELAELDEWAARLAQLGIEIESRMSWPHGGHSIFFRDPDAHPLELLTRGTWKPAAPL